MRITIRSGKTEMVYETENPELHPLSKYTGGDNSKIANFDMPFERLIKLIETMSDSIVKMKNAKELKQ